MRADDRIRFLIEAARNDFGKAPPTSSWYFFEGNDWDDIVRVGRDVIDKRLKIMLGWDVRVIDYNKERGPTSEQPSSIP